MEDSKKLRPILLIEDDPQDIDQTLHMFERHRVSRPISICRDGQEALDFIARHSDPDDPELPAIILLDLRLPRVDGTEILERLNSHPVWNHIPVIVITASRRERDEKLIDESGVKMFLHKPIDFDTFEAMIDTIDIIGRNSNAASE